MKMNLKEKTVTMKQRKRSVLPVAISSEQDLLIVNCIGKYNKLVTFKSYGMGGFQP